MQAWASFITASMGLPGLSAPYLLQDAIVQRCGSLQSLISTEWWLCYPFCLCLEPAGSWSVESNNDRRRRMGPRLCCRCCVPNTDLGHCPPGGAWPSQQEPGFPSGCHCGQGGSYLWDVFSPSGNILTQQGITMTGGNLGQHV